MKTSLQDYKLLQKWSGQMGGVYSTSDLNNLFNEGNPVALNRRIRRLEENGVLNRFVRGYYVTNDFNPRILSARLNPNSYISLGTVLAEALAIGSVPVRTLYAIKTGRNKLYKSSGFSLQYLGISPRLFFGFENKNGVNSASPEKAFLDVLYFYQKGRKYSFNIFTDVDVSRLDRKRIMDYLKQYRNPKFVAFVKGFLNVSEIRVLRKTVKARMTIPEFCQKITAYSDTLSQERVEGELRDYLSAEELAGLSFRLRAAIKNLAEYLKSLGL